MIVSSVNIISINCTVICTSFAGNIWYLLGGTNQLNIDRLVVNYPPWILGRIHRDKTVDKPWIMDNSVNTLSTIHRGCTVDNTVDNWSLHLG